MADPLTLLTIVATFLLAGFVKGVIGLGLPTVAIGLLSLAMPPAQAAAILVVPSLVTNVWQLAVGASLKALLRRLWSLLAGICIGCWAGAGQLTSADSGGALAALGIVLVIYAVVGLALPPMKVPARAEPWLSPVIGLLTGVISAATGVFTIPAVPYLQALALERDELVQALGLMFTVATISLAVILARDGALQVSLAGVSLLALFPALAGMWLGQVVRGRVRPEVFRLFFFLGLLVLGIHLALRAVF
ncbi:MAG: uncharacterized protein QOI12_1942 [Alphaproteobacteria bacterium]|jgi:uncharacterized membrane protein YfcA|nr:uncharacterized protein [Alphaproteobacteria bacterium]